VAFVGAGPRLEADGEATIASLPTPAGSYLVTATLTVLSLDAQRQDFECSLANTVNEAGDNVSVTPDGPSKAADDRVPLVLQTAAVLAAPGRWSVTCRTTGDEGGAVPQDVHIQALRVGKLSSEGG
jgi:hypothetical protein